MAEDCITQQSHMMVDVYLVFGWQKSRMQMESATHIEREFVAS